MLGSFHNPCSRLQWGRNVSVAEIQPMSSFAPKLNGFNGAATFPSRRSRLRAWRDYETIASMGPQRFRRGDFDSIGKPEAGKEASMGPQRFRRGDQAHHQPLLGANTGFNGAATFPSRR